MCLGQHTHPRDDGNSVLGCTSDDAVLSRIGKECERGREMTAFSCHDNNRVSCCIDILLTELQCTLSHHGDQPRDKPLCTSPLGCGMPLSASR